jgi:hypothetical protein
MKETEQQRRRTEMLHRSDTSVAVRSNFSKRY